MGFVNKLKLGLEKTKNGLMSSMESVLSGKKITDETLEEFEELLIMSDMGVQAASDIVEAIESDVSSGKIKKYDDLKNSLRRIMVDILGLPQPFVLYQERPFVVFCVGVNGVGKTTTIGKIAHKAASEGNSVILSASDTFRAAAIEQLTVWSERSGSKIVRHQPGSDPAAVAFDTVEAARARGTDLALIDTAGRLHTKNSLMEELRKIKRVIDKAMPGAPHETLIVVDATTGQNALNQVKMFDEAVGVTGIALTKLDGTAKGGIVLAIKKELNIPVRMIGVGEGIDDLRDFIPDEFVSALFD